MRVTATLLDVMTGYQADHEYFILPEDRGALVFMWEDGNYACDCNRLIFLYGVDIDDAKCSNGMIACLSLKVDGAEVYSEARSVR